MRFFFLNIKTLVVADKSWSERSIFFPPFLRLIYSLFGKRYKSLSQEDIILVKEEMYLFKTLKPEKES